MTSIIPNSMLQKIQEYEGNLMRVKLNEIGVVPCSVCLAQAQNQISSPTMLVTSYIQVWKVNQPNTPWLECDVNSGVQSFPTECQTHNQPWGHYNNHIRVAHSSIIAYYLALHFPEEFE
jgi:hypothetical protein